MEKLLLYKDWLDSFKREVDAEMERLRKAPVTPAPPAVRPMKEALESLRSWWDQAYEDPTAGEESLSTRQVNQELELSRKEVAALKAEVDRLREGQTGPARALHEQIRALGEEKSHLEEQMALAVREIARLKDLKELKATLDQELGGLRIRMSSIRGEYEARIRLLQEAQEGLTRRAASAEADLKDERERRLEAEKAVVEGRRRLAEADGLRAELQALRGEVQTRLESAAEFLEAKIRSVQDQNKGQAHQFRELVEALRRGATGGLP